MKAVRTGISTGLNPFGPQWGTKKAESKTVGQQMQNELFGGKKPKEVEPDDAHLAAQLARLHAYRKKLVRMLGDDERDYDLTLAEGTIASIDASGKIYVGKRFLLENMDQLDLLVGVLAHEIGHRPKRWKQYKQTAKLSKDQMEALCRQEETYADYFAGKALAELGMSPEPMIAFLKRIEEVPHPEYFPAHMRADVIRDGYKDGKRKATNRKKFFPEFARMTAASGDLGGY